MSGASIQPSQVTSPIQVVAAVLAALVLVEGPMLAAAAAMGDPTWLRATLVFTAIACVPAFLGSTFLLLTRFRPQIQGDEYYAVWLERTEKTFVNFSPENLRPSVSASSPRGAESSDETERRRIARYEQHLGLFLVHSWRPSVEPGQVADIVIQLFQHGEGPLSRGQVANVEYHLGPKFFKEPVLKSDAAENFRLEVSAYGPVLCLARVKLIDGRTIDLDRYINF